MFKQLRKFQCVDTTDFLPRVAWDICARGGTGPEGPVSRPMWGVRGTVEVDDEGGLPSLGSLGH